MPPTESQQETTALQTLDIKELTALLIRHYDLHEGDYDLLIEFQIGVGAFGPDPNAPSPGAMVGVSRVGLTPAKIKGPGSVDAAQVNPKTTTRKKPTK